MKLKEIQTKYRKLSLIEDRDDIGLFAVGQKLDYDLAVERYGERKVIYTADFDDIQQTEVLVESEKQFRARNKFNL